MPPKNNNRQWEGEGRKEVPATTFVSSKVLCLDHVDRLKVLGICLLVE